MDVFELTKTLPCWFDFLMIIIELIILIAKKTKLLSQSNSISNMMMSEMIFCKSYIVSKPKKDCSDRMLLDVFL